MRKNLALLAGLTLLTASFGASAATIEGTVEISGAVDSVDFTANTVTFGPGANVSNLDGLGDLAPMTSQENKLTLFDFSYDPFTSPTQVWSFDDAKGNAFAFELSSLSVIEETTGVGGFKSLHLAGVGNLSGAGYDTNPSATYDLMVVQTSSGFTIDLTVTDAAPVPIPAAGWLFGSAIFGAAALTRRRRAEKAAA